MALLIHSPEFFVVNLLFYPYTIPKVIKGLKNGIAFSFTARAEARAGSKVGGEGCKVRVLELNHDMMLYGQFSAPVKQEAKRSKEEVEKKNYYVNMGYATLREKLPDIFYREIGFEITGSAGLRASIGLFEH